ncbi:hypothetical protein Goari_019674, partial [Gossypium aridum]|nr:hypothetical protein [Gossypium aridum]
MEAFGEWKLVIRRSRKPTRKPTTGDGTKEQVDFQGPRFNVLHEFQNKDSVENQATDHTKSANVKGKGISIYDNTLGVDEGVCFMMADKEQGDSRPKDVLIHNFMDPIKKSNRPNIIMGSSSKGGNKSGDLVGDLSLIHVGPSSSNLSIDKTLSAQVTSQNFNNMLVRGKHISMVKRVPKSLLDAAFHSVDPDAMSKIAKNIGIDKSNNEPYSANGGLSETRISGLKADKIVSKLGFDCSHIIKARGFFGGLWVCWKKSAQVHVINNDPQFVHFYIKKNLVFKKLFVTFVYGSP